MKNYISSKKMEVVMLDRKKRILICEDDLNTANSIKDFLEKRGFNIHEPVTSGRQLMETATNYFPSLIISNITLKGELDGIEAISRINELIKIPYIFVTEHSEYTSLIDSYFLHPLNILIKPIDLNELYSTINQYFNHLHSERPSYYYLG
jgi:DNA-binding NtrC family response regulator